MKEEIKQKLDKLINYIYYQSGMSIKKKNRLIANINYLINLILIDKYINN